jgi:pimeloyl-ACP methyl ester carboxylesterase
MAVELDGEGPPVLCIHGLGGTSNTFTPQMPAFLGRFRVIRPDLPGAGRSALPEVLSIATLADAMASVCDAIGERAVHVAAHSLGTLVAQHLAATRPEMVKSLVLLGALMDPPDTARRNLTARAEAARKGGMASVADVVAAASLASGTRANNLAAVAFVRESLMRQPAEGYALSCEALAAARAADARAIACTTLLLTGEEDAVAPASVARSLAERINGARAEILPHCGHWAGIERPNEVNRAITAFYARLR